MVFVILSGFGIAMLMLAIILRLVEHNLPESARSGDVRTLTRVGSITFYLLAFVLLLAMVGVNVLIFFLIVVFIEADVRMAGLRQRAWQAEFLWVLAIAVKTGQPLADEVDEYAKGTWGVRRRKLLEMAIRLRQGESLEEICQTIDLLPQSAVMQIHTGISAQSLQESLGANAARLTRELADDKHSGLMGAGLAYPIVIFIFMGLINTFVMYYIIPKFKKIFDDFGTELPAMTIALIRLSDSFINYCYLWIVPFFFVPMGVLGLIFASEFHGWRQVMRRFLGPWFVRFYSPDVLRSLSLWTSKSLPIDDAFEPIYEHRCPPNLSRQLRKATSAMKGGVSCWDALRDAGFLNRRESIMLDVAQQTGNLPWALTTLAETMECRRMFRFRAMLEVLQPVVLLSVAVTAGFVVISLFLPLIKLLNDLS